MSGATDAREDWEARIGRRSDDTGSSAPPLDPPGNLEVTPGRGQVTLRWSPVDGAMGYLVHAADSSEGPFEPLDHGGGDVLAVPGPPYADTTGDSDATRWYAVAAVRDLETGPGPLSEAVAGSPLSGGEAVVDVAVAADRESGQLRRIWQLIGSERLSQLRQDTVTGGEKVAEGFAESLRIARDELGVDRVRAHAILHDDVGVYRERDGEPEYDFTEVDAIYDRILRMGVRPVVELSFMPRDLARNPDESVFAYTGIISPPRSWERWGELVGALAQHLVDRYGLDEVATWGFEVWNEPNLEVFWSGTFDEYVQLYAHAVRAVKAVDERLLVGGPATAATGWVGQFLDAVAREDLPLDFVATHTYGNYPLDVRPALRERGYGDAEVWWTEWGVTPTHFNDATDAPFGAPFLLHGMKSSQERVDALAHWVVSDHFEELGRPDELLHGGFGLLTVGNLRKPRYLALQLAAELGDSLRACEVTGDGAGAMVDAWASRSEDGTVDVLVWNGTLDQSKAGGAQTLARTVRLRVSGLGGPVDATLTRVDAEHGNLARVADDDLVWPDAEQARRMDEEARLRPEPIDVEVDDGTASVDIDLPMPGVARLRLRAR